MTALFLAIGAIVVGCVCIIAWAFSWFEKEFIEEGDDQ